MSRILALLAAAILFSCSDKAPKDYVTLQGNIKNKSGETLFIKGREFEREITVDQDGSFKDTMRVAEGFHGFEIGDQRSYIYLKNGYDLELNFDGDEFPGSVAYDGSGSATNNYFVNKTKYFEGQKIDDLEAIFTLSKDQFEAKMLLIQEELERMIIETEGLEEAVIYSERMQNQKLMDFFNSSYAEQHEIYMALKKGSPSPKFNYPDTNGNNVSLDDLKGKYVYVDVWATWCGPCKKEIPYLKELNREYEGKDLAIVSLSIDKLENKDKWLKMVEEEELKGIQIIADKDWESEFVTGYFIQGIPRFILIDKEGNILDADAPRPSDPALKEFLNSLNI